MASEHVNAKPVVDVDSDTNVSLISRSIRFTVSPDEYERIMHLLPRNTRKRALYLIELLEGNRLY